MALNRQNSVKADDTEIVMHDDRDLNDLEDITSLLIQKIRKARKDESDYISRHSPQNGLYLKSLKDIELKPFNMPEVVIALFSDVSGGKSSFMNSAVCHYPICPVAKTTTSICVVETRRAAAMRNERIEICLLTKEKNELEKEPVCTFQKQVFDETLFRKLLDYAVWLADNEILETTDTLDFFRNDDGEIAMTSSNWRHCMVLLMIVFDAYVYQDKRSTPGLGANYQEANRQRDELFQLLNVPMGKDHGIRLYWCSDCIPEHASIVDLPGIGSATVQADGQLGHTQLVGNYLSAKAHSLLFFIDDRATITDPDVKNMLDTFLAINSCKGPSSARVTIVVNKADKADDDAKRNKQVLTGRKDYAQVANSSIQTTISGFRQAYPCYAAYPVYALSSWNGEWLLRDSDIPLGNLHHAGNYIAGRMISGQMPTEQDIKEEQKKHYDRAYPYQANANAAFGTMSFEGFLKMFITDYVHRIQFLNALEHLKEYLESVNTIAGAIEAERTLFTIARDFTPTLAQTIADVIHNATDDAIDELNNKFAALNSDMQKKLADSTTKISAIANQFDTDYGKLNDHINTRLQNKISGLQKDGKGRIPIDGNWLGTNETGANNYKKIMELADQIAKIDFLHYFTTSFAKLKEEFSRERKLYCDSIAQISDVLLLFPDQVISKMEAGYDQAMKEKNLQDIQGFNMAFNVAKTSTKRLLDTVCHNYAKAIKGDNRVNRTLDETSNRIQSDLLNILAPYTNGDYGSRVLGRISKSHFFRANTIDQNALKSLLTSYYISDFKSKMDQTLKDDIEGTYHQTESHIFRMSVAVNEVGRIHMSQASLEKLQTQVDNACNVTDGILSDPSVLSAWGTALDSAAEGMKDFFTEDTAYHFFHETASTMTEDHWAAASLELARELADITRNSVDSLMNQ